MTPPEPTSANPAADSVEYEAEPVHDLVQDARRAFYEHVQRRALAARERYGPVIDLAAMRRVLADDEMTRYPIELTFAAEPLEGDEFALTVPRGFHASDGFFLFVHPFYRDHPEVLPALIAYHLPTVMYGAIADANAAELFGAVLLNMETESYYDFVCHAADARGAHDNANLDA